MIAVAKAATNHHFTHKIISIHKQQIEVGSFHSWLLESLCQIYLQCALGISWPC